MVYQMGEALYITYAIVYPHSFQWLIQPEEPACPNEDKVKRSFNP